MTEPLVSRALEAARCAQINFDNLVAFNRHLDIHPMYVIARTQLDDAVKLLEGDAAVEGYEG